MQYNVDKLGKYSEITSKIISAAMEAHTDLGPGYQEIIYHRALVMNLTEKGLKHEYEKEIKIVYKNKSIGLYKLDLVVEDKVIVELKAVTGEMPDIFRAQVISYLKASGYEVALLLNFGEESLIIRRLARYKDYKH